MTFNEIREKVGWLLENHCLLTVCTSILIAGPIRGILIVGIMFLIAK